MPVAPVPWEPPVESEAPEGCRGVDVVVDDVEEFVEDVAEELLDSVLTDVVMDMANEIACEVVFEEDASDIWDLRRRDSL